MLMSPYTKTTMIIQRLTDNINVKIQFSPRTRMLYKINLQLSRHLGEKKTAYKAPSNIIDYAIFNITSG